MMKWTILFFLMYGCELSWDSQERNKQEEITQQAGRVAGMPAIQNFQEKKILKNILELRDTEIKTITYTQDMSGKLHKICDSIGYGVPYATQYTNPSKQITSGAILPQADPNGLFSPSSAEGTWIMCLNPETTRLSPVYIEPKIIVSPFHMKEG